MYAAGLKRVLWERLHFQESERECAAAARHPSAISDSNRAQTTLNRPRPKTQEPQHPNGLRHDRRQPTTGGFSEAAERFSDAKGC